MSQLPEIIRDIERVSADVVAQAAGYQAAILSDVAGRRGTMHARVAPVHESMKLAGPAFTVEVRPGDNLMIHKALMMVQPGDVLVIDGGGDLTQALMGGLMRTTCLVKQLGGLVIDGAVRDRLEWAEGGLPVFARGHTHRGPSKEGPGEINVPIACAGLAVLPGDLVLGDADGLIAIPAAEAATVLERAQLHLEKEARIRASNLANNADPERFNALLRAKGLPV